MKQISIHAGEHLLSRTLLDAQHNSGALRLSITVAMMAGRETALLHCDEWSTPITLEQFPVRIEASNALPTTPDAHEEIATLRAALEFVRRRFLPVGDGDSETYLRLDGVTVRETRAAIDRALDAEVKT